MSENTLSQVKDALGITGDYLDKTLQPYLEDVEDYIKGAGVSESNITIGILARGVSDLWNYGTGEGKLSPYFMQRVTQLKYKK